MKCTVLLCYDTYDAHNSLNARWSFCYNTSIAEMYGVPLVTTRRLAEMHAKIHGWNQELQRSLHGHTLAETRGVSFCYNTLIAEMHSGVPFVTLHMTNSDSWNTRTKSRAAMLSLRTYDSWNAQCSFVTSPMITAMHWWNLELQCFLYGHTIAEMHDGPFDTTHH